MERHWCLPLDLYKHGLVTVKRLNRVITRKNLQQKGALSSVERGTLLEFLLLCQQSGKQFPLPCVPKSQF